jgi:PPOX class probable F420-dependent enzyme
MLDTTTQAGAHAEGRLREETIAWLTTVRSDGQPQSVPVWFLWDGESVLIYSRPDRQKQRNIRRNSLVGLDLNSNARGGDVVRVEGTAEIIDDASPANEVGEYVRKYRESIARIVFDEVDFARLLSGDPGDAHALAGLVNPSMRGYLRRPVRPGSPRSPAPPRR